MKSLFYGMTVASAIVSTIGAQTINNTSSTVESAQSSVVLEFNIQDMTGSESFSVATAGSGFVKKKNALVFSYLSYAKSWTEFVKKYPTFKFTKLNIKTSLKGSEEESNLSNITFNTADFKTKASNGMFTIKKIKSTYITDFIYLSVVSQVKESTGEIKFGIMYNLNITQQYAVPYPFYDSKTEKIQFFQLIKN